MFLPTRSTLQDLDFPFIAHALSASLAAVSEPVAAEPVKQVVRLAVRCWKEEGFRLTAGLKGGVQGGAAAWHQPRSST